MLAKLDCLVNLLQIQIQFLTKQAFMSAHRSSSESMIQCEMKGEGKVEDNTVLEKIHEIHGVNY